MELPEPFVANLAIWTAVWWIFQRYVGYLSVCCPVVVPAQQSADDGFADGGVGCCNTNPSISISPLTTAYSICKNITTSSLLKFCAMLRLCNGAD